MRVVLEHCQFQEMCVVLYLRRRKRELGFFKENDFSIVIGFGVK